MHRPGIVVVMLAGCYGPDPQPGSGCVGGMCPPGLSCDPLTVTCERTLHDAPLDPFASLSGKQWLMPCTTAPNPTLCDCVDVTSMVTVGGAPGTSYNVSARIRGVMERGTYTGGTAQGMWYVGGTSNSPILTVAKLVVSSPAQTYYLNYVSVGGGLIVFDYTTMLPIDTNATITLAMSATDGREVADSTTAVIPGVTTVPSPYLGQFAQIDVIGSTPR